MNGTPLNSGQPQQPVQPQPQSPLQEPAPRRSPWMAVGIALIVIAIGAIVYLIMGGGGTMPPGPTPTPLPGGSPSPTGAPSGNLDQDILREIGEVSAGRTVADIDQDIQATNLSAIDQELEALDQEMRGL